MSGEKLRNKLPYLLWVLIHIKCNSQESSLWPFHAFSLFSGLYSSQSCYYTISQALLGRTVASLFSSIAQEKKFGESINTFCFPFDLVLGIRLQELCLSNMQQIYGRYGGKGAFTFFQLLSWYYWERHKLIAIWKSVKRLCKKMLLNMGREWWTRCFNFSLVLQKVEGLGTLGRFSLS